MIVFLLRDASSVHLKAFSDSQEGEEGQLGNQYSAADSSGDSICTSGEVSKYFYLFAWVHM